MSDKHRENPLLQGIERTDDDYQLDDVFMSRAAGMQSEAKIHQKEKLASLLGKHLYGDVLVLAT